MGSGRLANPRAGTPRGDKLSSAAISPSFLLTVPCRGGGEGALRGELLIMLSLVASDDELLSRDESRTFAPF